jgi:hypothetical protein
VVEIGGLPSLDGPTGEVAVDVDRLLSIRDHPECREMRQWLRNIDSETDDEIERKFGSVREELASMTHGRVGNGVRMLVTNGLGLVPGVGIALGVGAAAADKLLIDKLIGAPGPVSFLSKQYPSIFQT